MSDPLSLAAQERAAKPAYEVEEEDQTKPIQTGAVWVAPEVTTTHDLLAEEEEAEKEKKKKTSTNLFGDLDDDPVFQKKPKKKSSLFADEDTDTGSGGGLFGDTGATVTGNKNDKPKPASVNLFGDNEDPTAKDLDAALNNKGPVPEAKLKVPTPSRGASTKEEESPLDVDTGKVAHSSKLGNLFDGGTGPDNEHETGDLFIAPAKDDDEPDLFGGPGARDLGELANTERSKDEQDLLQGELDLGDDTVRAMEKATTGGASAGAGSGKKKAQKKSTLFDDPPSKAQAAFDDDDDLFSMVDNKSGGGGDLVKDEKFSFADYIAKNKSGGGGGLFDD